MTYPRAHLVDALNPGRYHCISRCVRRAWLCGKDPLTGRSFEHRRHWLEQRILALSSLFAVRLYGYAVMSNHYHLVLELQPNEPAQWTDNDVAERWLALRHFDSDDDRDDHHRALLACPHRLSTLRQRLGSLSWFMAKLNEPIARRANAEDQCKGRFWEGRFKSLPLLDETALLAAMAYVDLNPVRAAQATAPEHTEHTALARRLQAPTQNHPPLVALEELGLDLPRYLELLHWTTGTRNEPPVHRALNYHQAQWTRLVEANRQHLRAYGPLEKILELAHSLGQRWIQGYRLRKLVPT